MQHKTPTRSTKSSTIKPFVMKQLIALFIILASGLTTFSQNQQEPPLKEKRGGKREQGPAGPLNGRDGSRIESLKIAFITRKLELTPEEAQKFWPVFNKYSDELKKTHQDLKKSETGEIEKEEKMLGLRKKYLGEFQKAVSTEKANNYFKIEKEFVQMLQKEMQQRRQRMGNNGGGPENKRF